MRLRSSRTSQLCFFKGNDHPPGYILLSKTWHLLDQNEHLRCSRPSQLCFFKGNDHPPGYILLSKTWHLLHLKMQRSPKILALKFDIVKQRMREGVINA